MACCQEQTEERGMISLFNLNYMLGWWRPNLQHFWILFIGIFFSIDDTRYLGPFFRHFFQYGRYSIFRIRYLILFDTVKRFEISTFDRYSIRYSQGWSAPSKLLSTMILSSKMGMKEMWRCSILLIFIFVFDQIQSYSGNLSGIKYHLMEYFARWILVNL